MFLGKVIIWHSITSWKHKDQYVCLNVWKKLICLFNTLAGKSFLSKWQISVLSWLLMVKINLPSRASYTTIIPLHTRAAITNILVTFNILTLCPRCIIITALYIDVVYLSAFETERAESELCRVAGVVLSLVSILFIEPNDKKEDNRLWLLHVTSRFRKSGNMASRAFYVQN